MTSICFISETGRTERPIQDPSVRYRCFHPAEVLSSQGNFCSVYSAAHFYSDPNFDYDVYIFHRPNMARNNFLSTTRLLRKMGKTLIADHDDLFFGDAAIARNSSMAKNSTQGLEHVTAAFSGNLAGLREFDKVSVSTAPLAKWVTAFHPDADVIVAPNVIPPSLTTVHNAVGTHLTPRPQNTIGYFPGARSHTEDFRIVDDVLHRILTENSDFTLLVVGPVEVPHSLALLPNVITAPKVNYLRLPGMMTRCRTVIAPLEINDFNACKSRVKFLEAALSGARLLASPIPDMLAIGEKHLGLMHSTNDWYEALSALPTIEESTIQSIDNQNFLRTTSQVDNLKHFWSEV